MRMTRDTFLSTILVICALTTTGIVIQRQFAERAKPIQSKPKLVGHWETLREKGVLVGRPDARVQLIEFADFECPFCANFHLTLKGIRQRYGTQVAITYIHFPLEIHRFALPAARAVECAASQQRFEEMQNQLFAGQASFGLKAWHEYAAEASVPDLAAFDDCVKQLAPVKRVEQGTELGKRLGIEGTPTLIVNGWMLPQTPSSEKLDAVVRKILAENHLSPKDFS